MRLYLRLAWRNIWRHRTRTLIVVIAMALTLGMMIWYDGVMAGFNDAIYGNALKVLGGNVQVHAAGYSAKADQAPLLALQDDQAVVSAALALPEVEAAARRIVTGGLASSREGAFPVSIIGIEPEQEKPVNLAAQHVVAGRYLAADDADSIFIGKGLADAMSVKIGDRITMTGRGLHDQMRRRTMTVVGIYDLGMADVEKQTIYVSLSEAQNLYDLSGKSTDVAITLKHLGQENAVIAALQPKFPADEFESYETSFPQLKQALGAKNGVMDIFSVVILGIAGIGILNLLLMAIYERTREIGLLGALGLHPGQISLLFVMEGTMMGFVGMLAGIVCGLALNALLKLVGMDFSAFAGATSYMALMGGRIYPTWGLENIVGRGLTVLVIASLAALYPAYEASQREPAEALHYV
jgi:ABC-type lipoprotein release transport system permease subunit